MQAETSKSCLPFHLVLGLGREGIFFRLKSREAVPVRWIDRVRFTEILNRTSFLCSYTSASFVKNVFLDLRVVGRNVENFLAHCYCFNVPLVL